MNTKSIAWLALGAFAIADWAIAASDAGAVQGELVLHVRVYDYANIARKDLDRALEVSSSILAAAGVRPVWERGEATATEGRELDLSASTAGAGQRLDDRGFLIVRFVRQVPATFRPGALGFALPWARQGVHVTLFCDRIEVVTLSVSPGAARIMGNALAHELGHALLGSGSHSEAGLMKAVWTRADYSYLASRQLEFDGQEIPVLREEVRRRARLWEHAGAIGYPQWATRPVGRTATY